MTKFIVLSGKKQSGKTTAANHLKDKLKGKVHITSFASPIKDFCTNVIGLTEAQVYGSNAAKETETHVLWDTMPDEIRYRYAEGAAKLRQELNTTTVLYSDKLEPRSGPMTAREVMQIFGTDVMRNFFDFDMWAKAPFKKYANSKYDFVIIDDCRFPNEANMALANGAILIRLQRDVLGDDAHVSEKAMDDYPEDKYHKVIDNNNFVNIYALHGALEMTLYQLNLL